MNHAAWVAIGDTKSWMTRVSATIATNALSAAALVMVEYALRVSKSTRI